MKRKRYKFTDKNQSRRGMISSAIGVLAWLLTAGMLAAAYIESGQAGKYIAVLGFLALLLSVVGLYDGIKGMKEEDTWHLFPWIGCVLNGLILAAYVLIYILGW